MKLHLDTLSLGAARKLFEQLEKMYGEGAVIVHKEGCKSFVVEKAVEEDSIVKPAQKNKK